MTGSFVLWKSTFLNKKFYIQRRKDHTNRCLKKIIFFFNFDNVINWKMACTINIFSQSFSYSKLRGIQGVIQICFKKITIQDNVIRELGQNRMKNYIKIGRKKYQKGGNQKESLDCKKICCNNPWLSDR